MPNMTKSERDDLQRLVRQREKVLKSNAKLRSTELIADFENEMAAQYAFDDDAVWEQATKAAEVVVAKAQMQAAARCQELGIPDRFAPRLGLKWHHTGYDNRLKERREELRRVAETRVEALEQRAKVDIEMASCVLQSDILIAGLTTEIARTFVESLPTVKSLMPALSYDELAGEADPPVVEQLVSPNALRQRRFRERHKALRDDDVTPQPALPNDSCPVPMPWQAMAQACHGASSRFPAVAVCRGSAI